MTTRLLVLLMALALLLIGCGLAPVSPSQPTVLPTPTIHTFFRESEEQGTLISAENLPIGTVPTVAPVFRLEGTPTTEAPSPEETDAPTTAPAATATRAPTRSPELPTTTVAIFDDRLNSNWNVANSTMLDYNLEVEGPVYMGERAIMITPQDDFSKFYFIVRPNAEENYPRDKVLGIEFWLSGGLEFIDLEELGISVVGSNEHDYWVADDSSATDLFSPVVAETRLSHLGLNRAIPPETWTKVEFWLDEREFAPDYEYVTGFYLKNDAEFRNSVFIDEVRLIMLAEDE